MNFLPNVLGSLDALLLSVLLILVLRKPFRRHTTFTLYVIVQVVAELAGWVVYYRFGLKSGAYRSLYWGGQMALDLLLFLVVIALAYEALTESPLLPMAAKVFKVVVAVTILLPIALLHPSDTKYGPFTSIWYSHVSQIWNFGAAIMNLVLWAALLSNRRRDTQLVTLSIGVGVATASAAIFWGARLWLPESNRWPLDSFMATAHILSLLVWCWAFRPNAGSNPAAKPPGSTASQRALSTQS